MRRLLLLLLPALLLAACGGAARPTASPTQLAAARSPTSTPPPSPARGVTGISEVDRVLDLVRTRNASGLHDVVGFEKQMCEQYPQPPPGGTIPCETVPYDAEATVDMTISPVFTFATTSCSTSYLVDVGDVDAALDDFLARHDALSIYGVGRGGRGKFDNGYRLAITDGGATSPDARASIWYLRMDGRLVRVLEDCQGRTAAALVAATSALAQPLLEPER